jgi:O-antigen/teichoic acid export membrane protein
MRGLVRNALFAVAETACAGTAIFLLYYFAVAHLGTKAIGAWSLASAATSVSRIGDIGVANALLRFVPAALARDRKDEAIELIETSMAAVGVLYFVILLLGEPLIAFALRSTVEPAERPLVLGILPGVLISFWLSNVGLVFLCALAGVHRYDQRSMASISGTVVQLGAAFVLISYFGILGLVWSQVIQNVLVLLLAWLFLRRHLAVGLIPIRFNYARLRSMFEFSVKLQLSSMAGFLFEPATKIMLSSYAGLTAVGYYEMASRMVMQIRSLLLSAVQVSTPSLAGLHQQDRAAAREAYRSTMQMTWIVTFPLMLTFAALIPAISDFWLGHRSAEFLTYGFILSAGWTINLLCSPAFFMGWASGYVVGNLWGWVAIATVNLVLGLIFGAIWGGLGVVAAAALSLAAGSVLILIFNDREFGRVVGTIFTRSFAVACVFPLLGSVISILAYGPIRDRFGIVGGVVGTLTVITIAIGLSLRLHPQALLFLKGMSAKVAAARPRFDNA